VAAAGVGGGSLHFANVVIDAHEDFFNAGWPPEINYQVLVPYYQKVSDVLHPRRLPANQFNNRTKLLKEAALLAGFAAQYDEVDLNIKFDDNYTYDSSKVPRQEDSVMTPNADGIDQGFCVHLGACVLGCPVEARNTLALNYLPRAEKLGAQVAPLHIVRKIEPIAGGGYRVHFDQIQNDQLKAGSFTGRIVVVSGGSIGSTELLLRCQKQHKTLPNLGKMLGSKWCTNANYLTPAFHDRKVYPSRGPTITAGIRFFGNNHFNGQRFMIEDGGVPDLLAEYKANMQNPSGDAKKFSNQLGTFVQGLAGQPFENLMPWFSQGRDEPLGKFTVEKAIFGLFGAYVLRLNWSTSAARKVLDAIQEVHRRLIDKTGGNILLQTPDQTITPHPLGGVPLGQTADTGVVNHLGESFAYKNLYVADGSIMPGPVGHNPSKTIAALSERSAESIVKEGR